MRALHNKRKLLQAEHDDARRRYLDERAKRMAINPLDVMPSAPPFTVESGQTEDGQIPTVAAMRQIELDQPRTFYTHKLFLNENSPGQVRENKLIEYLEGVCHSFLTVCCS